MSSSCVASAESRESVGEAREGRSGDGPDSSDETGGDGKPAVCLPFAASMRTTDSQLFSSERTRSLSSSFSNIGHDQAQTPGSETKSPVSVLPGVPGAQLLYNVVLRNNNSLGSAAGQGFNAVYSQALSPQT